MFMLIFYNCVGVIDDTHVSSSITKNEQIIGFRGRKLTQHGI